MSTGLQYGEDELSLGAAVRTWLDRNWDVDLLNRESAGPPLVLWRKANVDLGVAGLLVPEHAGGAGASIRAASVVAQLFAQAMAPIPIVHSSGVGGGTLVAAGASNDVLAGLASGDRVVSPLSGHTQFMLRDDLTGLRSEGGVVDATVSMVTGAMDATDFLVSGLNENGPFVGLVNRAAAGVQVDPAVSLDESRGFGNVRLTGARVEIVAEGDRARSALDVGFRHGVALLCAEQAGIARFCLDAAVEYAKIRAQFGRPIGAFQAIKHRLAEMWWLTRTVEASAQAAAAFADESGQTSDRLLAAKVYTADGAVRVAEECLQLHGGLGMTWESTIHLYLKRAKSNQHAMGSAGQYVSALADQIGLVER